VISNCNNIKLSVGFYMHLFIFCILFDDFFEEQNVPVSLFHFACSKVIFFQFCICKKRPRKKLLSRDAKTDTDPLGRIQA